MANNVKKIYLAGDDDQGIYKWNGVDPKYFTTYFPGRKVILAFLNLTWNEGLLPSSWKTAIIKPIFKKGKQAEELKSYRPISFSSSLGKLAERIINQRLYWYLEANKILSTAQAGFRNGHRTEDQLFRLSQRIIDGFHAKKSTTAVFVDL